MPLLAQAVHVDLVAEQVRHGRHVGRQARQAQEHVVAVLEDLGEVVGHGQGLQAQAQVAGYGYAVFADHGHAGAAVCWGWGVRVGLDGVGWWAGPGRRCVLIEKGDGCGD